MDTIKLKDAVWNERIYGYGVSDNGDRFGGPDQSAEHGLCYPGGSPLTLRQAVELKCDIGTDASVIAFIEGERWPKLVELPH